jgi:hypothetical protein
MNIPIIPPLPEPPAGAPEVLDVPRIDHVDLKRNRLVIVSSVRGATPMKWTILDVTGDVITLRRKNGRGELQTFQVHIRGPHFFDGAGNQLQVIKFKRRVLPLVWELVILSTLLNQSAAGLHIWHNGLSDSIMHFLDSPLK